MPMPPAPRCGKIALELRHICKTYGPLVVFRQVELRIVRGSRVALVGPNGAGKSTLMRILSGTEAFDAGERTLGHNALPAFFDQDQSTHLDPRQTVLEAVAGLAPNEFVPQVRGLLGAFLFSGEAVEKRTSVLSGGERNRLALARLMVRPSNLLLLDEPTNHLDIRSKDVLLDALRAYEGTVVFVSHDRHFLAGLADHVVEVGGGGLREYPGDYESYLWRREREVATPTAPAPASPAALPPHRDVRAPQQERKARDATRRRRERRVAEIEGQIAQLEERKTRYGDVMSRPDFYAHREKADLYLRELNAVDEELAALYREWEMLLD